MQIEERAVGDVVVLDLKGKITLGEGDELLKDKVNSLVNQGHKKIVLNLADVPYIDSAGLGEVVRTYTTVSRQAARLDSLGLITRRPSKADKRVREAAITSKGRQMTSALDAARERIAVVLFAKWSKRDLQDLARLMRRFADDLQTLPTPEES